MPLRPPSRSRSIAALAAALPLLLAAPVLAAPTTVSWPIFIKVQAAPGTENRIVVEYVPSADGAWDHAVRDRAGVTTVVTRPPSCYPLSPAERFFGIVVTCPDGTSVPPEEGEPGPAPKGGGEDFKVLLGDRDDAFLADSIGSFAVNGGTGDDIVVGNHEPVSRPGQDGEPGETYWTEDELLGGPGDDLLGGRQGPDLLSGGPGADYLEGGPYAGADSFGTRADDDLRGGPGNDRLNAHEGDRDQAINCGPGKRDRAWIDRADPKPKGCEIVKRRAATRRELSREERRLGPFGWR